MKTKSYIQRTLLLLASITLSIVPELRSQEVGPTQLEVGQDDNELIVTAPDGLLITATQLGDFGIDLNGDMLSASAPDAPLLIEIPEALTVTFPDVSAPPVQLDTGDGLVISTLKLNGRFSVKVHRSSLMFRLPAGRTIKLPGGKMTKLANGQKAVQLTRRTSFKLPKHTLLTLRPASPGISMDPLPALKAPRNPKPN